GQISWPPTGTFHGRQWAVPWPPMGSFSWPLTLRNRPRHSHTTRPGHRRHHRPPGSSEIRPGRHARLRVPARRSARRMPNRKCRTPSHGEHSDRYPYEPSKAVRCPAMARHRGAACATADRRGATRSGHHGSTHRSALATAAWTCGPCPTPSAPNLSTPKESTRTWTWPRPTTNSSRSTPAKSATSSSPQKRHGTGDHRQGRHQGPADPAGGLRVIADRSSRAFRRRAGSQGPLRKTAALTNVTGHTSGS
ncbi:UNVERIFIED_ORG: hypothetical protein ABID57_003624, partial [Arthrobacter sp. UYEF1]